MITHILAFIAGGIVGMVAMALLAIGRYGE